MQNTLSSAKRKAFLDLLREVREDAGLRQLDVATQLNQPQSFVSKYESGERRLDLLELEQVCKACRIDLVNFIKRYQRRA